MKIRIIHIIYVIFLFGCNGTCNPLYESRGARFYTDSLLYDSRRLPLLEPFYAFDANSGNWSFYIPRKYIHRVAANSLGPIIAVNVSQQKIYGVCSGPTIYYHNPDTVVHEKNFFIIDPANPDSDFYSNKEAEYFKKAKAYHLNPDSIYAPQDLYQSFAQSGKLNWIH